MVCDPAAGSGWNHRPEEEGITTSLTTASNPESVGITALKKKGLRLTETAAFAASSRWNHRPEEEGITTLRVSKLDDRNVGITALKKKGLRLLL